MDVDLSNFEKEDFSIPGFYRALVEDNADPQDAGRVRVRILGIHSMDMLEAPTENLPWAEPVLPLAHSGGAANQHIDFGNFTPPKTKYKPTPIVAPITPQLPLPVETTAVNRATTEAVTIPTHKDFAVCNSGTGGQFAVPAKGSLVWIFFDGQCHLRPHYFAMATQSRDWTAQKLKLTGELADRDAIITKITGLLAPGADKAPHKFTSEAAVGANAIQTGLIPPTTTPVAPLFLALTKMKNLSSWTSPGGTTILTDHTWRNEQMYIMHKGYSQHIGSNGQVTKVVGSTNKLPTNTQTGLKPINASGLPNDETELNAGVKNLYIVGDYNLYVMGNCNIQCFQQVTINAFKDVGVVSRTGNVNVLAELGNINLESTTQSVNIKGLNIQLEADNNITLKSKRMIDLSSLVDIQIRPTKSLISEASIIQNTAESSFNVSSSLIDMKSNVKSAYISEGETIISSKTASVNGDVSILLNSKLIEAKGSSGVNIGAPAVSIQGGSVFVTGTGDVHILGAKTSVYGSASSMIGGGTTSMIGGVNTTVTGKVTLGMGTVVSALAGPPPGQEFIPPTVASAIPAEPIGIIPISPSIASIGSPSQNVV